MMAPINVTTSKQQITASVADDKITANVSAGFGAVGPSGVVNVTAPITNSGTTTSANVGISIGSGLSVSSGSLIVTPNTYATLVDGKIPAGQLPSYVDDVVEVATFGSLPSPGEQGKIYLVTQTNKVYRWTGFVWLEIVASPGSTDSIAEGNVNLYYTNTRAAAAAPVQSVAGRTGTVVLAAGDIASGTLSASRLPIAAAGTLGAVRIGSGISIDGSGVISASSAYTLPVAGSSTLGGVKVNGNGVSIDGNGVLSVSTNYAATSHSHGTLTSDGKLGTVSGQIVVTGSGGLVGTASSITPGQVVTETTYTNFLPEGGSLATALSGIDGALSGKAASSHSHGNIANDGKVTAAGNVNQLHSVVVTDVDGNLGVVSQILAQDIATVVGGSNTSLYHDIQNIDIELGTLPTTYASLSHAHSASDITSGTIDTARLGSGTASNTTFLRGDQTWATVTSGDTVSIDTTAADILSASSGSITADDAGADKLVFWDDSAGKLTYLAVSTGLSISGTTFTASVSATVASPSQITSNQNDYAGATADINRINSDAARDITGIAAGTDGQAILLINVGSFAITLKHQSTSSTAANRIIVPWGNDYAIPADGSATLVYDNTTARWRVL